jgi:hypothetical protein
VEGQRKRVRAKLPKQTPISTRAELAKHADVGERTFDAGKLILDAAEKGIITQDVVQDVRSGKSAIHRVAKVETAYEEKRQNQTPEAQSINPYPPASTSGIHASDPGRNGATLGIGRETIIDGHNRYEICTRLNIPFNTHSIKLPEGDDEDAVCIWIIDNQKGRRNVRDIDRIGLALKRSEFVARMAKEKQVRKPESVRAKLPKQTPISTRAELAKHADVGERTFDAGKLILDAAEKGIITQDVVQDVRSGKSAIHRVAKVETAYEEKRQNQTPEAQSINPYPPASTSGIHASDPGRNGATLGIGRETIIDGHNRYEICTRLNIPFNTHSIKLDLEGDDEDAVCIWIIDNQKGRRNVRDIDRIGLALKRSEFVARMAKEKQVRKPESVRAKLPKQTPISTRAELAKHADVGERTFDAGKLILDAAEKGIITQDVVQDVRSGKSAIHRVAKVETAYEEKRQNQTPEAQSINPYPPASTSGIHASDPGRNGATLGIGRETHPADHQNENQSVIYAKRHHRKTETAPPRDPQRAP